MSVVRPRQSDSQTQRDISASSKGMLANTLSVLAFYADFELAPPASTAISPQARSNRYSLPLAGEIGLLRAFGRIAMPGKIEKNLPLGRAGNPTSNIGQTCFAPDLRRGARWMPVNYAGSRIPLSQPIAAAQSIHTGGLPGADWPGRLDDDATHIARVLKPDWCGTSPDESTVLTSGGGDHATLRFPAGDPRLGRHRAERGPR
jgi:hypothetical protein